MSSSKTLWHASSWQEKSAEQQPVYPDETVLAQALEQVHNLPPLVTSWEILSLKRLLAKAARGECFLLQGGDCAESFADCSPSIISNRLKVLLQMSVVLIHGLKMPVVRVGRFAGQYAKPRSTDFETKDGVTLPSYRGDLINGPEFTSDARTPDPQRLIQGHMFSALTMNFVRSLVGGGFADLHHPEHWDLSWMEHSPLGREYKIMAASIGEAVHFMETLVGQSIQTVTGVDFYTSHEALLLHYEQALTRPVPHHAGWFNLSTHFPWIGMRTAQLDGAHVEYCRGIQNPIAIKIGPNTKPDHLLRLCDVLDPLHEAGRLTLIHRMGASNVTRLLPPLLKAVQKEQRLLLWCCDPMHGNTESLENGLKTRRFENIRQELELAFDIHADSGSRLGGVHLELTGENVTECLGGARDLLPQDLSRAYKTAVDPRLNYEQSLELAMLIVRKAAG
jgi:3-deoxy-7-phosphoheptulonate synthase